jgi:ferredoxin
MNDIVNQAQTLLENKTIDIFIGYEKGTRSPRPAFVSNAEDAANLIFDETCSGNLAVYLTRKDLVGGKKVGIAASYYALKNILLLFEEYQLKEENLRIFTLSGNNEIKPIQTVDEIRQYLTETTEPAKPDDDAWVKKIDAMTVSERWEFWTNELSRCFKCYACRAACPMCYCAKCITDHNRPQWIQPWSSTFSNMDWQINRVMHMAGRCSDCGACGAACPLGIPVHLLSHKMMEAVKENFGTTDEKDGNVLAVFKPDDKDNFIV